jgi:serine/threonine protein kinase
VPRCHGRLDRDALLLEEVDGRTLTRVPVEDLRPALFEQLHSAVAAMHDRGILHNDLRHRTNILVTTRGELRLVDFAGSLDVGRRGLRRWLFGWLGFLDRSAAIKWWLRYFPDLVPAGERKWYRSYLRVRHLWPVRNPALARQGRLVRGADRES